MNNDINQNNEINQNNQMQNQIKKDKKPLITIFVIIVLLVAIAGATIIYLVRSNSVKKEDIKNNETSTTTETQTKAGYISIREETVKNELVLYAQKVVKDTQTQYVYDANLGNAGNKGVYVYDITSDLGYDTTAKYSGFVIVDTRESTGKYILSLHDDRYAIVNWNVNDNGDPKKSDIQIFSESMNDEYFKSSSVACHKAITDDVECLSRLGNILE